MSEKPIDFLLLPFFWMFFLFLFVLINIFLIPYQKAVSETGVLENLEAIKKMPKEEYDRRRKIFLKENKLIVGRLLILVFIGLLGLGYTFITKNIKGLWIIFAVSCAVIPLVIKFSREVTKKNE